MKMKKILFGFLAINFVSSAMAVGASETDRADLKSELQDNYDDVRGNEQSLANRTLGATAMATVGAGGQMTASSLSEQKSDADAERDMAAYLATFRCDWGSGRNVRGGETNVELPGAGQLIPMYSEYVTLANDLKLRKAQLGLKAGIESEPILDSATTGLYDDVSTGISSGAYASLARALQNPNGADAKMWAEQKEKTAENLKTGAITAGVGAAVGLIGNIISTKAYNNKLDDLMKDLEKDIGNIPKQNVQCPSEAPGTYPNCACKDNNQFFNPKTYKCETCSGGMVITGTGADKMCKCPSHKKMWDYEKEECFAMPESCTPECTETPGSPLWIDRDCQCRCDYGFTYNPTSKSCECNDDGMQVIDGYCTKVQIINNNITEIVDKSTHTLSDTIIMENANLFKLNSFELQDAAKEKLNDFVSKSKEQGYKDCVMYIKGYADPVGRTDYNQKLSFERANAVADHLRGQDNDSNKVFMDIDVVGMGENSCWCMKDKIPAGKEGDPDYTFCNGKADYTPVADPNKFAPCRRVEMNVSCNQVTVTDANGEEVEQQ